jgi:hypothetical protein
MNKLKTIFVGGAISLSLIAFVINGFCGFPG